MGSPNSYVGNDIVEAILSKLPVTSLLRFKAVSNNFLSLISSPRFISTHHQNSKSRPSSVIFQSCPLLYYLWSIPSNGHAPVVQALDQPAFMFTLVGCANGLVCIEAISISDHSRTTTLALWNPATKQCRHGIPCPWYPSTTYLGFGYHAGIEDYKLFAMPRNLSLSKHKPQVLQLRRGTWREIDTCIDLRQTILSDCCSAVVVTEVWYQVRYTDIGLSILSFDLKEDSFALIDPPFSRGEIWSGVALGVYDQKLCSFAMDIDRRCRGWMMVEEASWTEMFTIDLCATTTIQPPVRYQLRLWSTWQGTRLLLASAESYYSVEIIPGTLSHDALTPRCEEIPKFGRSILFHEGYEFVESLVSPILLEV